MKTPIKWLKDYVDIDVSPEELAKKLINSGFEVEDIIYKGKDIEKVVTCKILSIEKHGNADKLSVCQVDAGKAGKFQIVTGAKNVAASDIVPVALDGAILPNGVKIKNGELRGVKSEGMLCSGKELNLTEADYEGAEADGILQLSKDTALGLDIKDVLNLNEYILDISITANRPDCHSIIGIAREVSAVLNKPFKMPDLTYTEKKDDIKDFLSVEVLDASLCPRYMAKLVKNIEIKKSDSFIRERLILCGLHSINNIVDITNFILLEMGNPMHAFDYKTLSDKTIIVRRAKKGEKITTLDKKESILDENMLVIADKNKPCALAGIMGGVNSGIENNTESIVFECAEFERSNIRKTSRALNVHSDSSIRFEKGLDSFSCETALKRALHLINKYDCGEITGGVIDILSDNTKTKTITATVEKINGVLGIEVPKEKIVSILNSLQIKTTLKDGILTCVIPQFREDIDGFPDLAEEVIRIYGYDKIESRLLDNAKVLPGGKNDFEVLCDGIRTLLCGQGLNEIITYSFVNENVFHKLNLEKGDKLRNAVKIFNPLNEDTAIMKTTSTASLLNTVSLNLKRKNLSGAFFEIGRVYIPKKLPLTELPEEKRLISIAIYGENDDFYTLKGIVENIFNFIHKPMSIKRGGNSYMHSGICAEVYADKTYIGYFGEVNPYIAVNFDIKQKVYFAELDLEALYNNYEKTVKCKTITKFPGIDRDLAIVLDEKTEWKDILETVSSCAGGLLENIALFDIYKGDKIEKGKISLAFSLKFSSFERTLKTEEVNEIIEKILTALKTKFKAELRC